MRVKCVRTKYIDNDLRQYFGSERELSGNASENESKQRGFFIGL